MREWVRIVVLVAFSCFASTAAATYTLPAARAVKWQGNVGSTAAIPASGKVIDCTQPPFDVPTDGEKDSAGSIRACLNNIADGEVAYLPEGTYLINRSIYVPSNKTLRGAGIGKTVLKGVAPWHGWGLVGFNPDGAQKLRGSLDVSGSLRKGSTSITTATPHHLSPGDHVIIDQLDDPDGDPPVTNAGAEGTCWWCGRASGRSLGQIDKVTSVTSPTSFTVEIPLYWNYKARHSPQVTRQPGLIVNAGVEALTIDNSVVHDRYAGLLWYAANCWFYAVEVKHTAREGISVIGYRNTIRGSRIHDTPVPLGPNSGYGLRLQTYASGNLVENNHIYRTSNPILLDGQVSGNVIAYNWLEADDRNTGRQNGAFSSHGAHPMMNLVEGNYMVGNLDIDNIWGSSSHFTFFRNRMLLQTPFSAYPLHKFLVGFRQKNWYQNMIGNVLWNSGHSGNRELSSGTLDIWNSAGVYVLGYTNGSNAQSDRSVAATLLRHGNYDYLSKSVKWHKKDDRILPSSLYLSAKPSFLGSAPWPPIGPDVSPMFPAAMPWGSDTNRDRR